MTDRQTLVAGRYLLLDLVGAGGMGRVWLARDEMLHREVAVKEIVPPAWMTPAEQARLRELTLREARSAARIDHPHVVKIYDVVHTGDQPWIVMEYVPSRSLYDIIGRDGPLPPEEVIRIGTAVLEAITAAHSAGVLHRDIKPHNVLIGPGGRVVLTDFGLATFADDGAVTGPGPVVASPHYVAPERAKDGTFTRESDLWSFGATLYAAVEGRSPYARDSAMATLTALATEPPDPFVRAGPLAPVLTGLLRRDPADRLTAPEVARLLRTPSVGRASVPSPPPPPGRRAWKRPVLAGALVLALLGVAAGVFLRDGGEREQAAPVVTSVPPSGTGGGGGGFSPVACPGDAPAGLPTTPQRGADQLRKGWSLLEGWSYFSRDGFRIAVPDGWTYETVGTTICFRDPASPRVLSVDASRNPQGDPVKACREEVSRLRGAGALPGYRQYRLDRVGSLTRAADWEYAYDDPRTGTRMHAMTRWVASGGEGYAYGLLARDLDWPATFATWGMIVSTFSTGI
ncbi:serine/threonine-protein kinase [Symbioplanes lichenis]|uniref:serine/threonine-protein kinase n=1 Tax=Symbioplanes lichenis TaxID=1629072 RepID=UPI002739DD59|nr:serine/threonine-protein kinase [Actinoplanes lichenis]